jgi:exonuclease-1
VAKEKLEAALRKGDLSQARQLACKCVDVTPDLALPLLQALRKAGIPFIVAPYEADAQMAALCRAGRASAVLTEDSDLVLFGAPVLLLKMTPDGDLVEIRAEDLFKLSEPPLQSFSMDSVSDA